MKFFQGIQGIEYEQLRLNRTYSNELYRGTITPLEVLENEITVLKDRMNPYEFRKFYRDEYPIFDHYQLRHMVTSSSFSSLYFLTSRQQIRSLNPITEQTRTVIDLEKNNLNTKISCMAATEDYLLVGGIFGEYILKPVSRIGNRGHEHIVGTLTDSQQGMINHLKPVTTRSGAEKSLVSCNDNTVKTLDINRLSVEEVSLLDFSPNCISNSPDKRLLGVVGDSTESYIMDIDSGKIQTTLYGHIDYSFACDWSSDGRTFVTSSQDLTTRLYDTRFMSNAYCVIPSKLSTVRSLQFNEAGSILTLAESSDYIQLIDPINLNLQVFDFLGAVSGCVNRQDSIFVGIADSNIGGILELTKRECEGGDICERLND
jgi:WD40 repeat protein